MKSSFSFFRAPILNLYPEADWTLADAWRYITGPEAQETTWALRALSDKSRRRAFKSARFDYVTFSGRFTKRGQQGLIAHSGLLCIDFDHLTDVEELFQWLLQDEYFDTQLLFRSPSGDGLKWVVPIDLEEAPHEQWFDSIYWYCRKTYGMAPDDQCKDVARACFLPHDPNAFLHPDLRL